MSTSTFDTIGPDTIIRLPHGLDHFFDAEHANYRAMISEQRCKGRPESDIPLPCLSTALDSLRQAPVDVVLEWFEAPDSGDALLVVEHVTGCTLMLAGLIERFGADALLEDIQDVADIV